MALSGSLEEVAVLDVVQFVNQAHLSGALLLKGSSAQAELFYRKGGLVHARLGESTGLDVLVDVVDWTAGSFVFHPGLESPGETINMDLHRAVMYALKTRDERRQQLQQAPPKITLTDQLADLIAPLEFVRQAAIFDSSGVLASAARAAQPEEDLAPLCKLLIDFSASYVRGRFRRAILDDEKGTVLVSGLQRNRWIVIIAGRGTALGAVTVGMGRLVASVEALAEETQNSPREVLAGAVS